MSLTTSPTLDADGIPRAGLVADGVVSSADGSDERWPKWSTLQQQQLDLGTGEWRQDRVDWWAPASLAHRTL